MFRITFLSLLVSSVAWSVAEADLFFQFDPSQTSIVSNGSDQFVDVDLLLNYVDGDSGDAKKISSFTILVYDPDPSDGLTIPGPFTSPLTWENGPTIVDFTDSFTPGYYFMDATNTSIEHPIPSDNVLATARFKVAGSVVSGSYPLDLFIVGVNSGTAPTIINITDQASAINGTFTVSAVPEPSAFLFLSLVCGLISVPHLRRRMKRH